MKNFMNALLDKFIGLLESETGLYQALLSVLKKEKNAVVASNLKALKEAGKEKEPLLRKIRILEEQRMHMLKRLADFLGYSSQDLTLTKLSQLLEEPYAIRLKVCCLSLLELTQNIKKVNHSNKALLMHSLDIVRGSLILLDNIITTTPVYYRTGEIQNKDRCGKLLSGKI
ncbi:MAG: flagellar protein FlgN [Deltaproteobacteria bacterium]|nr:flagellar protein FlgN [Deltaproteobacteria bacterium]MBW2099557.1 flagellar protein FlgN [Deltaproteobacteria bacterium]